MKEIMNAWPVDLTTYSCTLLLSIVCGSKLGPDPLSDYRAREKTEDSVMVLISVKPAHFAIINFKVILSISMP